jgi:L-ascorbate metabolism protein UlaG (beta-lactamase superfamily)/rhodanese-related sulfurtransferase
MKVMSLLTALLGMLSCASCSSVTNLKVDGFDVKAADPAVFLVDVRTPDEYAEGHLRGAANIDCQAPDFLEQFEAVCPKETPVAVYCRTGRRSAEAAKKLSKAGYDVTNLEGGIVGWQEAGKPVTQYAVETFFTDNGAPVRITLIKHGTLEIACKGLSIQIDPVSGLSIPTDYATEFPKADVILVTHEHGDHFDRVALEALGANADNLITNARVAEMLGWGTVMANGDSRDLPEGIHLDAVPAYNYSEGRTNFHPQGRDNGFILTIDGLRIYVAGDTEDIPEMANIKDIDVAFLPVNQPYTMTVDQCVHAAEVLQPKVLIPYHFSNTDLSGLPARLPGITVLLRQMQ